MQLLFKEKQIKPKYILACYIISIQFKVDIYLEKDFKLKEANKLIKKKIKDSIIFSLFKVNKRLLKLT